MSSSVRLQLGAAVLAAFLVSALVLRASQAAFTGTTTNGTNSWSAGTVTLSNNKASAMFTPSALKPGDTNYDCITVTYNGSATPSDVKLYVASLTDTPSGGGSPSTNADRLSDDLDVKVDVLSSTAYASTDCATFAGGSTIFNTGALNTFGTSYGTGHSTGTAWQPTSGQARVYKVTWTLGSDTANDAQGDSVSATFTWEAQAGS